MKQIGAKTFANQFTCVAEKLEQEAIPSSVQYIGMEEAAQEAVRHLMTAMFPLHFGTTEEVLSAVDKRERELKKAFDALACALGYVSEDQTEAARRAMELIETLPEILGELKTDIIAAYEGDPAATGFDEVILTYPAFKTIWIYRIAHRLYQMSIPILPRMLTEYAHRMTGIDIHPGATLGKYFFIDHGTGVVIGETTTIGNHVKLYQNVTLGAKSFAVKEDGSLVKGTKRHPDLGDHVIVYAGATILGGETSIGHNCVIGGNVWLTRSLEANKTITIRAEENE